MKTLLAKASFLLSRPSVVPKRMCTALSMFRGFSTNNNNDEQTPKQFQNVFTQPSAQKEDQMDRASANSIFEELKEDEEKVDDREKMTKNLSLSLLQTETPE